MKRWILGFVVGALLAGASAGMAEDIFRIEFGRPGSPSRPSERDLQWRVNQLERAVDQLQRKVFDLQFNAPSRPNSTWTTCFIKTPFDGTFSATEPTETAARAGAIQKCNNKNSGSKSIFCDESKLQCGK